MYMYMLREFACSRLTTGMIWYDTSTYTWYHFYEQMRISNFDAKVRTRFGWYEVQPPPDHQRPTHII